MITVAMNAQSPALAVWRLNLVSCILRKIDHLDSQMIGQGIVFCSRSRQFQQSLQLLVMGQMIEVRHARFSLTVPAFD